MVNSCLPNPTSGAWLCLLLASALGNGLRVLRGAFLLGFLFHLLGVAVGTRAAWLGVGLESHSDIDATPSCRLTVACAWERWTGLDVQQCNSVPPR